MPPYGAAHNATANPDGGYLQQETVDAIANLATAIARPRHHRATHSHCCETHGEDCDGERENCCRPPRKTCQTGKPMRARQNHPRMRRWILIRIQNRIRKRRHNKNRIWTTHTGGGKIPGTAKTLLLDVRPRMQAQQFQVYQLSGRPHVHGHQEGHAKRGRSTTARQEG